MYPASLSPFVAIARAVSRMISSEILTPNVFQRYNLLVGALETTQVDIRLARGKIDADALVAFGAIAVFDPLVYSGDLRSDFLAKRRIRTDSGGH